MLGFSLTKILFTVLLVLVVLFGLRVWRRAFARLPRRLAARGHEKGARDGPESARADAVQDLAPCPACGAYIPSGMPCACGHAPEGASREGRGRS